MARGRNAGFERLLDVFPDTELVQFIDGDCELVDGYLEAAVCMMQKRSDITVVTGRRIERYPEASIYNLLCDIEWSREIGDIRSCGGDMMVRSEAFYSAGMFNPNMIAGEEPELCVRLRKAGGLIFRIDHDMTLHDAAMHKFSQWWKRAVRGGHACAEGTALHGRSPERHKVHELYSTLMWGAVAPIVSIGCAIAAIWWPWALAIAALMLTGYMALAIKTTRYMRKRGFGTFEAKIYALSCIVAKFPYLIGITRYLLNRLRGRRSTLIEYKHVQPDIAQE
jgi:hypothetical protein